MRGCAEKWGCPLQWKEGRHKALLYSVAGWMSCPVLMCDWDHREKQDVFIFFIFFLTPCTQSSLKLHPGKRYSSSVVKASIHISHFCSVAQIHCLYGKLQHLFFTALNSNCDLALLSLCADSWGGFSVASRVQHSVVEAMQWLCSLVVKNKRKNKFYKPRTLAFQLRGLISSPCSYSPGDKF